MTTVTLEQFKAHCADIDKRLRAQSDEDYPEYKDNPPWALFDCGHEEVAVNEFYYKFDGFMGCKIFFKDGVVYDMADCCRDDELRKDPAVHSSIEAWKIAMVKELRTK